VKNSARYNCLNYLTIPRVVLDPNTDSSSAAPSPAEPRGSKPPTLTTGARRRPARDSRPSPLSLTVDGS
jgi:hypothetical protein